MKTKNLLITLSIASLALFAGCREDSYTDVAGVCPEVVSTNPLNNATLVPLNKVISVTFNEKMSPETFTPSSFSFTASSAAKITAATSLKSSKLSKSVDSAESDAETEAAATIPGTIVVTGETVTFTPTGGLTANTTYVGRIKPSVMDLTGNNLQTDFVWTFSTGITVLPTVILTDPLNLATNVPLNKLVSATFSVPMDAATLTGSTFTVKQGSTNVAGSLSYTGSTAIFTPSANLLPGLVYTATLTTGVKNTIGTSLASNHVWTFTTEPAPTVLSTDPLNLATNVAQNKTVTATFSVAMDPTTITSSTFTLKNGANTVAGTLTYTGSVLTFNPTNDLDASTVYTATITTGVKNGNGIAIAANHVWSFTTAAAVIPTVLSTSPLNLATNVAQNKTVTATFSVVMDQTTLTSSTFTLKNGATTVAGALSYSGFDLSFNPTTDLDANTVYTATITTGAKNLAGTALAANFVWSFTTAAAVAPSVLSTDPNNLATNVARNKTVAATFSTSMDPLTITASTFTLKNGATTVAGLLTYTGSTLRYNPTNDLDANTVYTATITTGVKNLAGTALAANFVWSFTTAAAVIPTVTLTDPLNNATQVSLGKTVTATFSTPMDPLTITASTFTLKDGATTVAGALSYTGSKLTFNPTNDLDANTSYTATITTGAKSLDGTSLANNFVWSFTTVAAGIPTVILTEPLDLESNVALNVIVSAIFSEPMDPLTINASTFTLKDGAATISGSLNFSGSTLTFNPTSNLDNSKTYTATITTGAKNMSGTALANTYIWTFSTIAVAGPGVVNMGTAADFVAIGKTGISTTGLSSITGDIGASPGAASTITGFGLIMDASNQFATSPFVTGKIYASDYAAPTPAKMTQAVSDMETALTTAMGMTLSVVNELGAGNISGMTLVPGLYKWGTGLLITSEGVTLAGGPNDTWVFQISQDFTVENGAIITLTGGAQAKNIFWVTDTQALLGTTVDFKGNIISQTLISLNTGAKVTGRCLAQSAVTLNAATIIKP